MFALLAVMTGSGQNYSIDPSQPVSSADVEITAVNVAFFDNDSIRIVSPDEAKPAMARRRVMSNDITNEGDGGGPAMTMTRMWASGTSTSLQCQAPGTAMTCKVGTFRVSPPRECI